MIYFASLEPSSDSLSFLDRLFLLTSLFSVLANRDSSSVNQGISAASKIVFRNCDESVKYVSTDAVNRAYTNLVDWDGSVSGVSGGAILGANNSFWNIGSDCVYRSEWRSWVCPKTAVCISRTFHMPTRLQSFAHSCHVICHVC